MVALAQQTMQMDAESICTSKAVLQALPLLPK
jgi:hypothetical protein